MTPGCTSDAFLGGKIEILQPEQGYRAGQDPVLLAAATPIETGQSFADLGSGVGTTSLCLARRVTGLTGIQLEKDEELAALATQNVANNHIQNVECRVGDLFDALPQPCDWVLSNPPFFSAAAGRLPADPQRAQGRHGAATTFDWVRATMKWVRPRGRIGFVLSSAQIPDVLAAFGRDFGGAVVVPLLGRPQSSQISRALLFARQGSKSDFRVAAPFTIRQERGDLTPMAVRVLGQGQSITIPLIK